MSVDSRLDFATTFLTQADRRMVRVYADGGVVALPVHNGDRWVFGHYALGEPGILPGTVVGRFIGATAHLEEEVPIP